MRDDDSASTTGALNFCSDCAERFCQCIVFGNGHSKRMIGVDAGKFQRRGFNILTGEGLYVEEQALAGNQVTLVVHPGYYDRTFQQRIRFMIEAARFQVEYYGEIAAKTMGYR